MAGGLRTWLKHLFPAGSTGRWVLNGFRSHPICFLLALIRSLVATKKLTSKALPIRVRVGVGQKVAVYRPSRANIFLAGNILVNNWGGSSCLSSMNFGENSYFYLNGDFELGPDVHLLVSAGATLKLGGRKLSSGSGITSRSRIMVENYVEVGADTIIAWDVFITDSDWHEVNSVVRNQPVYIGDNVWISHGVSVLKGARIPSGCIVGAKSLVTLGEFPEKALIAGIPATVCRTEIEWMR